MHLSATGFSVMPTKQYTWPKTQPQSQKGESVFAPFNYFSEGAAVCEVEVDTLTGDMRVLHASMVMDVGNRYAGVTCLAHQMHVPCYFTR